MITFKDWCGEVRAKYEKEFGRQAPKPPSSTDIPSRVQERIMRCGIEANLLKVDGYDDLVVLAHYTLLMDDVRSGRTNFYHRYA